MLYVIAAPSGAGKTTIVRELLKRNPGMVFSVSATTRAKRAGEKDGSDYFFVKKEDFLKMIEAGDLVEYELLFNGDYYGTPRSFIETNMKFGRDMIFDIDVNGALSIKRIFGNDAMLIFIKPPDLATLRGRLRNRGTETEEQISERMMRVEKELKCADRFDKSIVNDDLEKAINEIQIIINQHKPTKNGNRNQRS